MKTLRLISYLLLLQVLAACTYYIELPVKDLDGKLFAECFVNERDTNFIRVKVTSPVNADPVIIPIDSAEIIMRSGEEKLEVHKYEGAENGVYYSIGNMNPGASVRLEIDVPGKGGLEAEDVVPPLQDFTFKKLLRDDAGNLKLDFQVSIRKSEEDQGPYGIRLLRKDIEQYRITGPDGKTEYRTYERGIEVPNDISIQTSAFQGQIGSGRDEIFQTVINGEQIYILPKIKDMKELTVDLVSSYREDRKLPFGPAPDSVAYKTLYNITLYHLSEDTYRYLRAQNDIRINYGARFNLAAPSFAFTNIRGGYGVLGCCSRKESGWVENFNPVEPLN